MKKIFKNNLKIVLAIIITAIICISTTAYAITKIYARDITFTATNENFTATNVEDAINELYEKSNNGKSFSLDMDHYPDAYLNSGSTGYTNFYIDYTIPEDVKDAYFLVITNRQGQIDEVTFTKISGEDYILEEVYHSGQALLENDVTAGQNGGLGGDTLYKITAKKDTVIRVKQNYTSSFNARRLLVRLYK